MDRRKRTFIKSHGLGNDFIIFDFRRGGDKSLIIENAKKLCDRHFGIGADQLIIMLPHDVADAQMVIYNSDGSKAGACGNGARCVARVIGLPHSKIFVEDRIIKAQYNDGEAKIDMGKADIIEERSIDGVNFLIVNIGNLHAVTFAKCNEERFVSKLQSIFKNGINVNFAQKSNTAINLRVYERGAGLTLACASGACATMAAAVHNGLVKDTTMINLPGGALRLEMRDEKIYQTGPAEEVFAGVVLL